MLMFDTNEGLTLKKSTTRRWLLKEVELTSGSCIEVNIDGHWIRIVIECDSDGYYAIPLSVNLHQGLWARFIDDDTD